MKKSIKTITRIFSTVLMLFMAMNLNAKAPKTAVRKVKKEVQIVEKKEVSSVVVLATDGIDILKEFGADDLISAVGQEVPGAEESGKSIIFAGEEAVESIISYLPDLVLLEPGKYEELAQELDERGVEWMELDARSIQDIMNMILDIGDILNRDIDAQAAVSEFEEKLKLLKELDKPETPVTVYCEASCEPYTAYGAKSLISDLLEKAGAANVFGYINTNTMEVREETIIEKDPMVILIPQNTGISVEDVMAREGWSEIQAIKNGRVYVIDTSVICRQSSACLDSVYTLSELLAE